MREEKEDKARSVRAFGGRESQRRSVGGMNVAQA